MKFAILAVIQANINWKLCLSIGNQAAEHSVISGDLARYKLVAAKNETRALGAAEN
jgi:hypothetical protein